MIYFDNASTSKHKPVKVKYWILKALGKYNANPGRSGHTASMLAGEKVFETRQNLKQMFNAPSASDIVFTSGCTEALNIALQGTVKQNGHIVLTTYEHNSVLRTVEHLAKTYGVSYTIVKPNGFMPVNPKDIESAIQKNTYLVITNHVSNVTGTMNDIHKIGKITKKHNLLFLVDAAQSAGHEKIDIQNSNINMLALAGHKGLLGPQGIGVLALNNTSPKPIKFGGTGTFSESIVQPTEIPESLESGTQATPLILGLNAGVSYVSKNLDKINTKTYKLTSYLLSQLQELINIKVYSNNPKSGVLSFEVIGKDHNTIVNILNEKYNIAVRSGLHCAPLIHKHLHNRDGLIRVSLSHKNKKSEINKFVSALSKIINQV